MATLYTVLKSIQGLVSTAVTGLTSLSPDTNGQALTARVGIYWPSEKTLHDNVRKTHPDTNGPTALITVYDRGLASDSTRWKPHNISNTALPATMTVVTSATNINPLSSITLTFGGVISIGDAVGIVLTAIRGGSEAVVPIAISGDTPTTMAAQALALILADPVLTAMVTASVAGPVLTLASNMVLGFVKVTAHVGNNGIRIREIGRRKRHFQIVVWARTTDDRTTIGDPIEAMIATNAADFGLLFADGTMARMTFTGDTEHDEAVLSDVMRRDFMICVDYGITVADTTYAILAPIARNTTL